MELLITANGNKYTIQDKGKGRTIYTVKKKGFGAGKYVLLDTSNYNLYSLVKTGEDRKPSFIITHNGAMLIQLSCKSMFLDPTINVKGKNLSKESVEYVITSKDRREFDIINNETSVGQIKTLRTMNNELQYEMEIENKIFDDYIPLFAVAVDLIFGELNKSV